MLFFLIFCRENVICSSLNPMLDAGYWILDDGCWILDMVISRKHLNN